MVGRHTGNPQMRSKRQTAWEAAAKCATLAKEADDPQEREHYARMRDAWVTLANRCEFYSVSDVTEDIRKHTPLPISAPGLRVARYQGKKLAPL